MVHVMKFGAKRTTPVVWTEIQFKSWHWVSTSQATTPQPGPLFISKQQVMTKSSWGLKSRFGEVWFFIFLAPLLLFFKGKRAKMKYLTNYWAVSFHFYCNDIYLPKRHHRYKNGLDWCRCWWDLTDWQWNVGFTPRAIRRVRRYWLLSSSGLQSCIWVLSLKVASSGPILNLHFKSTPIGVLSWPPLILYNGYNDYNGGWPSARLFGWSAADWSRPATNKSISSERTRKSLLFCWERKSWTSWLLTCCSNKGWAAEKSSKKGVNRKEKCFVSL